jgi:hypothetical protein
MLSSQYAGEEFNMFTQQMDVRYQRERHTVLHICLAKKFTQGTDRTGQDDICGAKKFMVTLMYHA